MTPTVLDPVDAQAIITRSQADPVGWAKQILGIELWSKQREIIESVRDNRKTAVRSCHGSGKTFCAAVTALWFLYSYDESRVITTATTWSQVKNLLWHEIGKLHTNATFPLGGKMLTTELHLDGGRYALGLSTKPEHLESFQGHHAPNILLIFDEASGVPQANFEAGEGYLTTEGGRWLLIGNPTQPAGEFYDAFHTSRGSYNTIAISAFDLPCYTDEQVGDDVAKRLTSRVWVEERRSWEGSPLWDVRVLGEFPQQTDDSVIPLSIVEAAQRREIKPGHDDPIVISCDVARFGADETVICSRHGKRVRIEHCATGQDLMRTTGQIIDIYKRTKAQRIVVDDDGVGGGVTDRLREQGYPAEAFNGGGKPYQPEDYPNRRSELWFQVADELLDAEIDSDEQLLADLVAPRYKLDSKGRRVVEPKEQTKKRLSRSPDRADALLLSFAAPRGGVMEVW